MFWFQLTKTTLLNFPIIILSAVRIRHIAAAVNFNLWSYPDCHRSSGLCGYSPTNSDSGPARPSRNEGPVAATEPGASHRRNDCSACRNWMGDQDVGSQLATQEHRFLRLPRPKRPSETAQVMLRATTGALNCPVRKTVLGDFWQPLLNMCCVVSS